MLRKVKKTSPGRTPPSLEKRGGVFGFWVGFRVYP
jgi:hypothetical protein